MQLGPTEPIPATNPPAENQVGSSDGLSSDTDTTQTAEPVAISRLLDRLQSGDSLLPNILLFGGVLLMVIVMMRLLRKNTKVNRRRMNTQGSPSERISEIHQSAQSSMAPSYKAMVDAEEMARRLGAILDNKAARLELLIEEADKKLNTLNRSLASSAHSQAEDSTLSGDGVSTSNQTTRTIDPSLLDRARVEQDLEERQTRVVGRIHPDQEPSGTAPEPDSDQTQSIQSRIYELAQSGLTSSEIARQLNQPVGQVELILNLRKQQSRG